IGVVASLEEAEAAAEFFELFKTPWETAVPGRKYRVLLMATEATDQFDADVLLVYGSDARAIDDREGASVTPLDAAVDVAWQGSLFPLFTGVARFGPPKGNGVLRTTDGEVDYRRSCAGRTTWRIGYNLFAEVRHLLTEGQPAAFGLIPTLELHIALLRQMLLQSGVSFVEIPAKPDKLEVICCLTHDVDFFGIKRHRWDRTLAGFFYRATIGTFLQMIQRRRTISEAVRNWLAALSVPLVFAGVMRDFWQPFEDYADADGNRGSTYFLAPSKKHPGPAPDGTVNPVRALPYDVTDIPDQLRNARSGRTEFALHGIDAWYDVASGQAERSQLTRATGDQRVG
ncbi:MAG TPA: hypothetical protein VNQ74_14285, partial [Burkholderiaceae bacterium]|nr:hypothetical protein [Burkholderiaceae bacterium]